MLAVKAKQEQEELVLQQDGRLGRLYEFHRCLLTLDSVNWGEFLSLYYDFMEVNYASKHIADCLLKENVYSIVDFVKQERKILAQFLEDTKDFEYKEEWQQLKNTGKRTAEILDDIEKWYKDHYKQNVLDVQNGVVLLA